MNGREVERLQSIWQFDIAQKNKKKTLAGVVWT